MAFILLVDKDDEWCKKVSLALASLGYVTIPTSDLGSAQRTVASQRIDLVISERSVNDDDDGLRWLSFLYFDENQAVLLLSDQAGPEMLPYLSKHDFSLETLGAAIAKYSL